MHNNTTSIHTPEFPMVIAGFYIFTGFCSLIGNSVVIIVMLNKHRNKRSNFRWLLVHLATCDMIFALFLLADVPKWIYQHWIYDEAFCKIIPSLQLTASLAAGSTVVVIALERYNGISQPLQFRWSLRHLVVPLLLGWIFSIASVSPYFVVLQVVDQQNGRPYCVEVWDNNENQAIRSQFVYTIYLFIGSFFMPIVVLGVLYRRIIYIVHRKKSLEPCLAEKLQKRWGKDIQITKLLISVVVAFALCVSPNYFGHLILSVTEIKSETVKVAVQYFMLIPYPLQCMINPLIYSVVDKQFRRDVKKVFLCRYEKRRMSISDALFDHRKTSVSSLLLSQASKEKQLQFV